jgi:hypothetical protein
MYEDDEDRLDAAGHLAEHNPHAATEALSAIARDEEVGDEVRMSAAEQLVAIKGPRLNPPARPGTTVTDPPRLLLVA